MLVRHLESSSARGQRFKAYISSHRRRQSAKMFGLRWVDRSMSRGPQRWSGRSSESKNSRYVKCEARLRVALGGSYPLDSLLYKGVRWHLQPSAMWEKALLPVLQYEFYLESLPLVQSNSNTLQYP